VIKRVIDHPGVIGVIVTQNQKQPIFTNMDNNKTFLFANRLCDLKEIAHHTVRSIDPDDELMVIRVKTNKYEIMDMLPSESQSIIVIQQNKI
jgi:dynein light chain roadblock-type